MATIKQGLWYQCKKSHPYFTEGNYYYSHSDDTLNDNRNRPYLVMPCERSHFGKGEVIPDTQGGFPIPKEDLEMYYEKLKQYKV